MVLRQNALNEARKAEERNNKQEADRYNNELKALDEEIRKAEEEAGTMEPPPRRIQAIAHKFEKLLRKKRNSDQEGDAHQA